MELNKIDNNMNKKLKLNKNENQLAGVCAGIADYMGCDKALVRLLFLVALFGFGVGPLAYLILWFIMGTNK